MRIEECIHEGFRAIRLSEDEGDTTVLLLPERGALAASFQVGGQERFFMDLATLRSQGNVRGGNPVLFPSPGKLKDDRYQIQGKSGELRQHGFARASAWTLAHAGQQGVLLRLESNEATMAMFPWEFCAELHYQVRANTLVIEQRILNRSETQMPFGFGFHPYFLISDADKEGTRIEVGSGRAFDNVTKRTVAFETIDLTAMEVDLHLLTHRESQCAMRFSDGGRVVLSGSPEYTQWVIWTLRGRDFVCLEPWTSPGNALNTGDRLLSLEPGETRVLQLEIRYERSNLAESAEQG